VKVNTEDKNAVTRSVVVDQAIYVI